MFIIVCILLAGLLILSIACVRANKVSRAKAWTLITLLTVTVLISAIVPPIDTAATVVISAVTVLIGGLGGSAPAAYFLSTLKTAPHEPISTGQELEGTVGLFRVQLEITKPQTPAEADGGGRLIGVFERLALTLSLVLGQISVLAVVVAVKGLARYPDIKSGRITAEKFIVGTFASLMWAAASALIAVNLR